jgi:ribose-phosphate pyrophosphokinase
VKLALLNLGAADTLVSEVAGKLSCRIMPVEQRSFPDGEAYVRLTEEVSGQDVLIFCSLDHANDKVLPLLFAADAARFQGARRVGLVAPYLAYMRQDRMFHDGEAVTSRTFARLLSGAFDWLLTVDPHLHRYASLGAIYSIPTTVVSASRAIAEWIGSNVAEPVIVGPDAESEQWVEQVATFISAPHAIFSKTRAGDYDVRLDGSQLPALHGTPVVVDDLISSARTMASAVTALRAKSPNVPVCVGVHALFAGDGYQVLRKAGPARICTTDTIPHQTNGIPMAGDLAAVIEHWAHG